MNKQCTICKQLKNVSEFYPDSRLRSGLRSSCKSCQIARRSPETLKRNEKRYRNRLRLAVLTHYSGGTPKCACCGETIVAFLCIDHINGNGCAHRRTLTSGRKKSTNYCGSTQVYQWLRKNNYPSGFQVLCFNCNMAKTILGSCPHND